MDTTENVQVKIMEELHKGSKQVRSFDDIAQLLHVVSIFFFQKF